MKRWLLLLCLTMSCVASPVLQAAFAVVEGVKMPAWGEHDGVRTALTPGLRLGNSDIVTTGSGGRVALKLEDQTSIKLGENAKLVLDNMVSASGAGNSYRGAISIPQGAFRLTTKPLYKKVAAERPSKKKAKKGKRSKKTKTPLINLRQHEFNVKLGALTAITQSVDVFGKSNEERDVIATFKGRVNVSHDDTSKVILTRDSSYVAASGSLNPPARAATQDLQSWKSETNLVSGRGIATRNGRWKVSVGTYSDLTEAEVLMHKLDEEGYAAEVVSTNVSGKSYARLQIPQMKTRQDAAAVAEQVRQQFDLDTVVIIR